MKLIEKSQVGTEKPNLFTVYKSTAAALPKWTEGMKGKSVKVNGEQIKFFADSEKSNYIMCEIGGELMCLNTKADANGAQILDATNLVTYEKPKPAPKPKKEKAVKEAKPAKPATNGKAATTPKVNKGGGGIPGIPGGSTTASNGETVDKAPEGLKGDESTGGA